MKNILVTGGKGQLASCIKYLAKKIDGFSFIFVDSDELDITNNGEVINFFESKQIDYCINCAAYTNVDKAESNKELAVSVNEEGVRYLAESCKKYNAIFIQISTDFVFDGNKSTSYKETDITNPLSIYGLTKLNGEIAAISTLEKHVIYRTSWLYSEYGNNFMKTMLTLGQERDFLNIVSDQIGTPTYAKDLAKIILQFILGNNDKFGTYHYSNEGVASWYDFAKAIFDETSTKIKITPIKSEDYLTPAKRPKFSVLDKTKIKNTFELEIPHWRDSLKEAICNLE
ncbi:dTDP-4-dehydrorhamnose reductase [Thalassobellus citreus]|uniref:dTDP-4-dehydrorhamnose reductase n=1 Tax=Thalassobellus citreus TaxID=3367752 RepID=UPI00378EF097